MKKVSYVLFITLCLLSSCTNRGNRELKILFTNDTHSQIVPGANNMGGIARRMGIIAKERQKNSNVLLVDAGDFCQGSPFFNKYYGKVEVDAMNKMGYDVVTLGNHEFDNGIEKLAEILKEANFDVVCSNYDFSNTPLAEIIKPYVVIHRCNLRIGIIGLTVQLSTLVAGDDVAALQWIDPYEVSQRLVTLLREEKKCDVVICLSHLGSEYHQHDQISDTNLAHNVDGIDIIVGGHTHKVVNKTVVSPNGNEVRLVQTGRSGIFLGKLLVEML